MNFQRMFSGAPWEEHVGHCRALSAGSHIYVTGTVPIDAQGTCFAPDDAYSQTRRCLEIIERTLQDLGAGLICEVRTRLFVTDIRRCEEYGRAHSEMFAGNPPATSMVQVSALIDPAMLVEIESDGFCPKQDW